METISFDLVFLSFLISTVTPELFNKREGFWQVRNRSLNAVEEGDWSDLDEGQAVTLRTSGSSQLYSNVYKGANAL